MVDAVRCRCEMKCLALAGKASITDYAYNPTSFNLPSYLQVPLELSVAQKSLHERAHKAIRGMKELMSYRDYRFNFLCPVSPKTDFEIHCESIKRLLEWKKDIYPRESPLLRDATLAPSPKLPKEVMRLHLDSKTYGSFVDSYVTYLERYIQGVWADYFTWKDVTENIAASVLNYFNYREWRHWWDGEFRFEMLKWEACFKLLPMPPWEDVVDELYLMILDRVDDADELANSLSRIAMMRSNGNVGKSGKVAVATLAKEVQYPPESEEIKVYLDPNSIDLSIDLSIVGEGEGDEITMCLDTSTMDITLDRPD